MPRISQGRSRRSRTTVASWFRGGLSALVAIMLAGCGSCGSCGSGPEGLHADEPAPHIRCLAGDPEREGSVGVGGTTLTFEERDLTLSGAEPLRFAAFAGPAPFAVDLAGALGGVRDSGVHFVVVLGAFGDDAESLAATLEALGGLELPIFLVPGGRDDAVLLEGALHDLDDDVAARIVDLSPFDRLVAGAVELVPVAGTPGGRYGRVDTACGFGADDLDDLAGRLGEANEGEGALRYLLSWAAPAGGIATGLAGAEAGDPALQEFAQEVGCHGGIFAWPGEAAGRVDDADGHRLEVVRRIAGSPSLRADGARPPVGPSFFTAGADGISSP
ncbi:MAG: hypothetical protein JRH11_10400 [Deltaproteobacteria bacterium]|nr:hypothetical protein [Deltaproteobacteria bacterium]